MASADCRVGRELGHAIAVMQLEPSSTLAQLSYNRAFTVTGGLRTALKPQRVGVCSSGTLVVKTSWTQRSQAPDAWQLRSRGD